VKFSTNGVRINEEVAARLAASDYVDVQISLDGATAGVNDAVRGRVRSTWQCVRWRTWRRRLQDAKISVVVTRHNVDQLDDFKALADRYGATCASPGCARRAAAPTWGRTAPRRCSRCSSTTGWSRTARSAHRRLVLPPVRARRPGALAGLNLCGAAAWCA
jgi:hypothetical protein